jgi:hypothetical protein
VVVINGSIMGGLVKAAALFGNEENWWREKFGQDLPAARVSRN